MKRGPGMLFLGLLFLVPFVDSARDSFMPDELQKLFMGEDASSGDNNNNHPANSCHSCLEISRKAKEILRDPTLFDEIASMFCRSGPSDSKTKCTKMVEMYKREAVVFLQEIAVEENFCNKTGFCLPDNADQGGASSSTSARAQSNGMQSKMQKGGGSTKEAATRFLKSRSSLTSKEIPLELGSNRTCTACHNVLDKLRNELEDPDKQLKIISSLIKACETEVFVYRCKKMVFAYGPIVITNLQKLVNMDLCRMMHICVDPKNQTDPSAADCRGKAGTNT